MKNIEPDISTNEDIKSVIKSVNFMSDKFWGNVFFFLTSYNRVTKKRKTA